MPGEDRELPTTPSPDGARFSLRYSILLRGRLKAYRSWLLSSCGLRFWRGDAEGHVAITNEIGEEFCGIFLAGIGRNLVNAIRGFVETLAGLVGGFGFVLHLRAESAFEHIDDDRTRATVRLRIFARSVGHLDKRHLEVAAIQIWQRVRKGNSVPAGFIRRCTG